MARTKSTSIARFNWTSALAHLRYGATVHNSVLLSNVTALLSSGNHPTSDQIVELFDILSLYPQPLHQRDSNDDVYESLLPKLLTLQNILKLNSDQILRLPANVVNFIFKVLLAQMVPLDTEKEERNFLNGPIANFIMSVLVPQNVERAFQNENNDLYAHIIELYKRAHRHAPIQPTLTGGKRKARWRAENAISILAKHKLI